MEPKVEVVRDFEGYFEKFVKDLIKKKVGEFKHHTLIVEARPWHPSACSYRSSDGILFLTFYSALRSGFGSLSEKDIGEIVELL